MKVIVAKNSGFCNGVRRSVDLANKASEKNIKTYTLGPLVHNPTQVKMLEKKGASVVDENEVLKIKNSQIVIRSHGVSEKLKENLKNNSNEVVDATCPVLLNIYKKIIEKEKEGYTVVIIGDKEHPEIKAMASYVNNGIIIKNETEAKNITNMSKLYVVSQTTNRIDFFENIAHELEKTNDDVVIENTICNATRLRQEACKSLSKEVDCMIVVGGFNSSNTNKLYQIAQKYCENVQRIETVKDLPLQKLSNFNIIGVIAGASTPDQVIEEVVNRMDDLTNEELMNSIEDSMKKIYPRDVVNGTIIDVKDDEVFVDIQYRADGIVKLDEMTEEQRENPKDNFEIGQEVEVYVIKLDDGEGNVSLSTRRVEGMKNWKNLREAYENDQTVEGDVTGANKGGLTARVMGINGFVPASQIAPYFVKNFKKFVGEHWDLKIISIDERKNRLVLSRKDIVEEKLDEQWDELEEGQVITGKVARLTDFGAFIEIGSLDGLLHVSDIAWTRVEHPKDVLNIGDDIEVKILKLNKEKNRISLGRKQLLEKPFAEFTNEHEVGDVITGKVVNLLDFGAFVEVSEGVEGLIHVSEISWDHVEKPSDELNVGDEVEVKILSIDPEEEKIGLSIKALKEAPERTERKPRRNNEENKNRSNAKAKRKAEKKEANNEFGDNDLNNNIGFAIEEVLSGIEIEDEDSTEE
ncbi:bifunctional 4-hydroxy-3-methylbut-2-enyl diphosphate reductase/30S ribosomal protein S1 [Anaerococcus vaginalis]|uniref:bifunctional 4-hydroxy-3-methylbut-2-enyl diphosphate reductase/30S ribosomal protein S1 n=1 Tax=Anaerococcus vaginalis TaxID=33037 RepID=UPI002908B10F|nr:bifunctional 4-hydroxy-3-methylbut-2-enyl diphosphate reductase/30S ribosomal protein S1 [Anaerococcus vaginalis]MDU5252219.1 bifunctional 4-hydroxy-3-methylbut-2-enyl diphosphate reductase/30S ribosomal protein S1 [Anaerococcus vaginalis]MDU6781809.1 bifunctional 4-hydroxy-3-methylbut-2-enyl diphosphate reductase/30S ribosomal protein S1 [Anaerococcus vaginalis]